MPALDQTLQEARSVFAEHDGMLRASDAIRYGVHPRVLYELRDRGDLERVDRGVYRLATEEPMTNPDFVTVAMRSPRSVICLISALSYYGLTLQIPHFMYLAVPSHARAPRIRQFPLRVFWYPPSSFNAGVDEIEIDKTPVRIFSAEKTLADCFKYRNKIGIDVAVEALRFYVEDWPRLDLRAVRKFARINRVNWVMEPYLEALS